jgi:hypothetical protein
VYPTEGIDHVKSSALPQRCTSDGLEALPMFPEQTRKFDSQGLTAREAAAPSSCLWANGHAMSVPGRLRLHDFRACRPHEQRRALRQSISISSTIRR